MKFCALKYKTDFYESVADIVSGDAQDVCTLGPGDLVYETSESNFWVAIAPIEVPYLITIYAEIPEEALTPVDEVDYLSLYRFVLQKDALLEEILDTKLMTPYQHLCEVAASAELKVLLLPEIQQRLNKILETEQ